MIKAILSMFSRKPAETREPDRAQEHRRRAQDADIKREVLLMQHSVERRLMRLLDAEADTLRRN